MNNYYLKVSAHLGADFFPKKSIFIFDDIIDAIAGIGSAGINYAAQEAANKANIRMNQETNAMNYQIAQDANALNRQNFLDQQSFDWKMWNATNSYNSPVAQSARLAAANVNPRIALGDQPTSAQSISSPSASPALVPSLQAGHVDPYEFKMQEILAPFIASANILRERAESRKAAEDAQHQALVNDDYPIRAALEFADTIQTINGKNIDSKYKKILTDDAYRAYQEKVRNQDYIDARYKKENRVLDTQALEAQQNIAESESRINIAEQELQLKKLATMANVRLSHAQISKINNDILNSVYELANATEEHIQNTGLRRLEAMKRTFDMFGSFKEQGYRLFVGELDKASEGRKSKSELNKLCERVFGFGFRDISKMFKFGK